MQKWAVLIVNEIFGKQISSSGDSFRWSSYFSLYAESLGAVDPVDPACTQSPPKQKIQQHLDASYRPRKRAEE